MEDHERATRRANAEPLSEKFTADERLDYLKQYGSHCMAYSTLQPGMEYFDLPGVGYIAYIAVRSLLLGGKTILVALADPIAAYKHQLHIAETFVRLPARVIFVQASEHFAKVLAELGLKVNQLGIETELDACQFTLHGKARSQLRHWLNKARKEHIEAGECSITTISSPEIEEVNAEWLQRKGGKELRLLTRPFPLPSDVDMRVFAATSHEKALAVTCFDPLYRDGLVYGYYQNHIRYCDCAPHGTSDLITVTALETFRNEGYRTLCLGLSPCAGLEREAFNANATSARLLRFLFDRCNFIYPFKGNLMHRRKFAGSTHPVYWASNRGTTWFDILAVLKAIQAW